MQNQMGKTLSALRKQVQAGLSHEFVENDAPEKIEQPVKIVEIFARAETARDELRLSSGYRP